MYGQGAFIPSPMHEKHPRAWPSNLKKQSTGCPNPQTNGTKRKPAKGNRTMKTLLQLTPLILLAAVTGSFALTGEEILDKMDDNRDHATMTANASMTIHVGDDVRKKKMSIKSITEGNRSLVEFTNPADKGTKYLMIDDNLWIYFPDENDVVKISGHMLKEGMMGSDVSYEDALEADKLSEKYSVEVTGADSIQGRSTQVVELKATSKDAPYSRRKMWVDTENYVAWKEEMFAKSGRLLKVSRVLEVKTIDGRTIPVKTETVNQLRRNSKTVFELSDVAFDVKLNESLFTMRTLRR